MLATARRPAEPCKGLAERFSAEILKAPILAYTRSVGLYAGATVKAGHISRADPANWLLYNTKYSMPELLYSDWVPPVEEVKPLIALLALASLEAGCSSTSLGGLEQAAGEA